MNRSIPFLSLLLLAACNATSESSETQPMSMDDMAAMSEMDLSTPHHERIMHGVGEWEGTISMQMPDGQTMSWPCTESVSAIGGLWTTGHFSMEFMGAPFNGASTLGYDTVSNKYVGTWADSMSPKMAIMEGHWDDDLDAIVMEYDMFEAMTGETKRMKSVTAHRGDSYTIRFFELVDGDENPQMQIAMNRKR